MRFFILKGTGRINLDDCYLLQFDGLASPNPGEITCGSLMFNPEDNLVFEKGSYLGFGTNNQAEYKGLIEGLIIAKNLGVKKLLIEGDSMLIIKQVIGEWKVKDAILKNLKEKVDRLLNNFSYVAIRHIPREFNSHADDLANKALIMEPFLRYYD